MREWIETNGLGSYTSLTYNQTNTRKFHGLLISSQEPPINRWLFVSNVYDTISDTTQYPLWKQTPHFHYEWAPTFTYTYPNFSISKTICMPHQKNMTIIRYDPKITHPIHLTQKIVLNSRHLYSLTDKDSITFSTKVSPSLISVQPNNINKTIDVITQKTEYIPLNYWQKNEYELDQRRNDSSQEYSYVLGEITRELTNNNPFYIVLSTDGVPTETADTLFQHEISRKKQLVIHAHLPPQINPLVLSADKFMVKRNDGHSIIAGYHWFSDWGRDTLIALPGLTMVTKRFEDAQSILQTFASYCKNGLIPNTFTDKEAAAVYNTVDAPLWYIDRVFQYLKYTNDLETIAQLWPTLTDIICGYQRGTKYDIYMLENGFVSHGPGLTWMDVKLGDYYPTPRGHIAVEIQALWFNALKIMAKLSELLDKEDRYTDIIATLKNTFTFEYDLDYDVIDTKDASCRPNQIFLASLDFSPLSLERQRNLVKQVHNQLLTIFGLRTLTSQNPQYRGSYLGNYHRDLAYHNGTVWPWLLGPYITAFVKTSKNVTSARTQALHECIEPMMRIFGDLWDGSIPEIFDGDPPFLPRGCITQAWSVAEILRAWVEDIEGIRPPFEETILHKIRV